MNTTILRKYTIFFCLTAVLHAAPEQGLRLGGNLYSDLSWLQYRTQEGLSGFAGMSTLELRGRNTDRRFGTVSAQLDLHLLYGRYADAAGQVNDSIPSSFTDETPLLMDLRELYMAFYPPFADIAIGRQIIRFGKGTVLSPLDIFSKLNSSDIDFKRSGSDVVHVKIPLGILSGIDLITELPHGSKEHSSAMKLFTNMGGFDLDAIALYRHRTGDFSTGAAFKGDILAGVYGEAVVHWKEEKTPHLEAMAGIDYSFFSRKLILVLEYRYNSAPIDADTVSQEDILDFSKPFNRTHYLFFNVSGTVNELLSLQGNMIINPLDRALQGIFLARYSLLQNISITPSIRGCYNNLNGIDLPDPDLTFSLRMEMVF
ncbi:MAG: hypothetical protein ACLFQB_01505 [Chitinispirillaceae bacterium]